MFDVLIYGHEHIGYIKTFMALAVVLLVKKEIYATRILKVLKNTSQVMN